MSVRLAKTQSLPCSHEETLRAHSEDSYQTGRIEPRHDKTNKVTVLPTKTQISLGIRPV